jgi:O-acetyl-ADP-ribose deacetylase (regulator of RNase III)/ADP-ribose pyrophosphatase YjhB (NUDIX family)
MKIKNCEIRVIRQDITELSADAIVNAANNQGFMGGGVAGAIKKKGGKIIEEEAVKKCPIQVGEAVFTTAGSLKAKYVIHAATMDMSFKTGETRIRDSFRNSLKVADELGVKSVAFPALGCGTGAFPLLASAKIMAQEIWRYLREEKSNIQEITFCLFDQEAYDIFEQGVIKYLEHILYKLQNGPFSTVDAIIEINGGIVLIERKNPPFGWALPGGFVDYGESLEKAVVREAKEETGLDIKGIKQFHTYSDPGRDPRFHTIGTVYIAQAEGKPEAGDDAGDLKIVKLSEIKDLNLAFDHGKILTDYLKYKETS